MYLVEDQLLENDFYFEAMEGLERVPWERCQLAVDQTVDTITQNFKIRPRSHWKRNTIMLAAVGLIAAGLGTFWIFDSKSPETLDLTTESRSAGPQEPATEETTPALPNKNAEIPEDSTSQTAPDNLPETSDSKPLAETPPQSQSEPLAAGHIAVGRIVDIQGEALKNIQVSADGTSDNTDKSGYYALRVPPGSTKMVLKHPAFSLEVEIDTSENWEIVVDVDRQQVIEKYPINAANRFK